MSPRRTPNPVWAREMRQAARLTRTPLILSTVTAIAGLLVCAVGGLASTSAPPAEVGMVLFQTFFSLAFAVVAWVGPGVAALTIASERAGRTWEAVVLTGIEPKTVALGKFLASLTYIGLYLAALAPVGALPFLFGGVTATEVAAAFALLGVFATLAIGFGLAVSSGASSPAMALLVTLPLAVMASMFTYFGLGMGLSLAAHELWPTIAQGIPVWLPTAYARADFGRDYVVYLLVLPGSLALLLAGFFREVTVANLSDANDDRSTGLKRWFVVASATITAIGLFVSSSAPTSSDRWAYILVALGVSWLLSLFTLFVLASDPPGPSRRVLSRWERERTSPWKRFMGPGIARSALLLFAVTLGSHVVLGGAGIALELRPGRGSTEHATAIAVFAAYAVCFFGFLAGFATFARSLGDRKMTPRARLALALFAAVAGPLFVTAIAGITTSPVDRSFSIAAPSPLYVFGIIGDLGGASQHDALRAGISAMLLYAVAGAVLGVVGAGRLSRRVGSERLAWATLDERLKKEDERLERDEPRPAPLEPT